ncbi:hypothetical protein GE061_006618 [Apolygus lucorum]|uniref:Cytochrome P450 n=1 Tax=Apolygus lucorum TaxID=248454 RepID=A0A8S9WYA6_APOLU|nr:hypothetical protein GE061_006618 [Apolygus lucorum]
MWLFRKIPGPRFIPLLGVAAEIVQADPSETLSIIQKYAQLYPGILGAYLLGIPVVVLTDPDLIKTILSSKQHVDKGVLYAFFKSWISEGLITSHADKWRVRRKLLNSSFHVKILEDNVGNFWKNASYMVRCMLEKKSTPIKLKEYLSRCTLDIISETAMGVTLNSQKHQNMEYSHAINRTLENILYRGLHPYLKKEWLWGLTRRGYEFNKDVKILQKFTDKVVRERISKYNPKNEVNGNEIDEFTRGKEKKPFLDTLIELKLLHPGSWKTKDIQEEVDTMMFAGHDTSSATTAFAIWMIGLKDEIQEKVYQEQYDIFGDEIREVSTEDLNKMTYLEMVIKETLRRFPTVPMLMRTLQQDVQFEGEPLIPAEVNLIISPFLLHMDKNVFPEPHVFDPERFTPEECSKRHPFSYIPFGAGPRSCIGQKFAMYEIKIILSTVIRFCKIKSITKEEDVKLIPSVLIRPSIPLEVIIEPRLPTGGS